MFLDITQGAVASTLPVGTKPLPDAQYETVRHLFVIWQFDGGAADNSGPASAALRGAE